MPANVWSLQWLNANSQRNYPLAETATGLDTSGTFTLPDDFLVGLDIPVHAGMTVDPSRFFVKTIAIYATGFAITIGYQPASGNATIVASALIPRDSFTKNNVYALGGINDFSDTVGKITVGKISGLDSQPSGSFDFDLAATRIEPDCVRPLIRGLTSLRVESGQERSVPIYGDVVLVAQDNFQIVPVLVSGQDPQLRFSAIKGEGLSEPCVCVGETADVPIRRINGIPPTPAGDFTFLGSTCVAVDGTDVKNGLQIRDLCSEPCCGCAELEAITRDLEIVGGKATTLNNHIGRIDATITQLNQVILGSRLNDRGCVTCE